MMEGRGAVGMPSVLPSGSVSMSLAAKAELALSEWRLIRPELRFVSANSSRIYNQGFSEQQFQHDNT
jgi:hypothetical protein